MLFFDSTVSGESWEFESWTSTLILTSLEKESCDIEGKSHYIMTMKLEKKKVHTFSSNIQKIVIFTYFLLT